MTHGPGLVGSLLVGVNAAKGLAFATREAAAAGQPPGRAHLLELGDAAAVRANGSRATDRFPVVVLIVSGGHTELILMRGHGDYHALGGTLDDAAGEAFDKVARLLELGFPGRAGDPAGRAGGRSRALSAAPRPAPRRRAIASISAFRA